MTPDECTHIDKDEIARYDRFVAYDDHVEDLLGS